MHISRKTVNINHIYSFYLGTFVTKVTATDADDPVYGNSAKLVYSILEGQPYFSIEPHTGRQLNMNPCVIFTQMTVLLTCCIQTDEVLKTWPEEFNEHNVIFKKRQWYFQLKKVLSSMGISVSMLYVLIKNIFLSWLAGSEERKKMILSI